MAFVVFHRSVCDPEDGMAGAQDGMAELLRLRAGRLRRLAVNASIPAVAVSLRRLAEILEELARKFGGQDRTGG